MKIKIKLNQQKIRDIENSVKSSALETIETLHTDLNNAQLMPFDNGYMQNGGTYTSGITVTGNTVCDFSTESEVHIVLTNDAPQARRLYYHPEYNFQTGKNANAGAYWLEPYLTGNKKDFVKDEFVKKLKGKI